MGHHHVLRFRFVHGLAIFLASGLGVENQQNGLREVPIHSMWFIFGVRPKRKAADQNYEHFINSK